MMQLPPRLATANADLADACQLAATASSAESDAFLGNVRIRFAVPSASGSDTVPTEVCMPLRPSQLPVAQATVSCCTARTDRPEQLDAVVCGAEARLFLIAGADWADQGGAACARPGPVGRAVHRLQAGLAAAHHPDARGCTAADMSRLPTMYLQIQHVVCLPSSDRQPLKTCQGRQALWVAR